MLQELAARTGAAGWAIGSMVFFLAVFAAVLVWVVLRRPEEMEARARMPLGEEDGGTGDQAGSRGRGRDEGRP